MRPLDALRDLGSMRATGSTVWVCCVCGKQATDPGGPALVTGAAERGWDESCYMHAVLCYSPPALLPSCDDWAHPKRTDLRWTAVRLG